VTVRPLRLLEGNDETLTLTVSRAGSAFGLAGCAVEMIMKPSTSTAEDPPATGVVVLSTATGEIQILDSTAGTVQIDIAAEHLTVPGARTYRVDVIDVTGRRTAIYGDLTVTDL
jgi:hypothetical protein